MKFKTPLTLGDMRQILKRSKRNTLRQSAAAKPQTASVAGALAPIVMRAVSPKLKPTSPYFQIVNERHELLAMLHGGTQAGARLAFHKRGNDSQLSSMNSDQKRQGLAEMAAIDKMCDPQASGQQ